MQIFKQLLSILIAALFVMSSLYAAPIQSEHGLVSDEKNALELVIDLTNLSTAPVFSKRRIDTILTDSEGGSFSSKPKFMLKAKRFNLWEIESTRQLIRYVHYEYGGHAISLIDADRSGSAKSLVVDGRFVGIGFIEQSRHFVFGKENNNGDTSYSARWGYRF